jgi:hypothetical protein
MVYLAYAGVSFFDEVLKSEQKFSFENPPPKGNPAPTTCSGKREVWTAPREQV